MDCRITYDEENRKYVQSIIEDVTFGVNNHECVCILGPNGAGKTTAISIITGNISYDFGTVKYGQKDLNDYKNKLNELSIGYCAQFDSLWDLLTVKETIDFYLNICGYPQKEIPKYTNALIEACDIKIHADKKICEISGGTKRKLSFITAFCSSPDFLILDEPSAGMDPFTRRYMWKIISDLKKIRETATILTSHSVEEAEALSDRIAILIKGKLVCIDTSKNIKMKNNDNHYFLEIFSNNSEQFEKEIVKGRNIFGLESNEDYKCESSFNHQKYYVKKN